MKIYEGKENLDIMSLAVNYNNTIFNWIIDNEDLKNKDILDFGSGKGEFCNRFDDSIHAVEIDMTMHVYLYCPSKNTIGNFDKKFDFIYSSNVLEHIENDMGTIEDFYNYLNPGGVVKILVPSRMELYSKMDEMVGHYRRYDRQDLVNKFIQAGFKVEYCRYFDFIGYFATLIYKTVDNSGDISSDSLELYDKYIFPLSKFIDKVTFGSIIGKNIILKAVKDV